MVGKSAEAVGVGVDVSVGGGSSKNKKPTLEEYGTNLTKLAEEGKLDPVVGRQDQIERVTQILGRRTKNHPCLIEEPGVGKTANAKGLAQRIANGDIPETIKGKKVEHNLFPRLPQRQLRKVSPFVKELCKKRGFPYNCASFWEANVMIVRTLKNAALQASWDFTKPVPKNLV
ncbi:chaperone protein ClpC [Forsythia ovata]|uniref:Chaperone protein ClpC n=1 Tax=Forsythia ovata TaxID=205694 RepID=A0ABD1TMF0_9LAMI